VRDLKSSGLGVDDPVVKRGEMTVAQPPFQRAPSEVNSSEMAGGALDATALLDGLPDATAVLDAAGVIVAVNRAWRMFSLDNGGDADATGVGVNYLDVCSRAAASGCADAAAVGAGLRAVLGGDTVESDLEYACPSPSVGRWFMLRITPLAGGGPSVLVSHVNISRQKLAEQEQERRASQDLLTGLANRTLLTKRLTAALTPRPGRGTDPSVGVLYIDLDGFKPVNDTFGHAAGDEVLQAVASRLRELVRSHDTVARLGGDEFALVAPRITADDLEQLVERVDRELSRPHLIHGWLVEVGASVGRWLAAPGEDAASCLQRADEAMYGAKRLRAREPGRAAAALVRRV